MVPRRIALLLMLAGCGARAPGPARPAASDPGEPPGEPPAATGARALLVVTGLSGERDDISASELAAGYCDGTIAVVEPARAAADAQLGCAARAVIGALGDALATARTRLVVTDLDHVTNQWKALRVGGVSLFERPADYPLVIGERGVRPDFAPELTHFIMTGVTAITRATGLACEQHGIEWLTRNLRPQFTGADYVHISNEVSIKPDCTYPKEKTYTFCTREADLQALIDLGANVIELTGNHIRDFGDDPFRQTLAWYARHDMATFGGGLSPDAANEPLVLPLAGGKQLGLIGFNELCPLKECAIRSDEVGANAYGRDKARAVLARLRDELGADFIIATVQFKEHDSPEPTPAQTTVSRELIDLGADLVYGSQAHQLQVIEFYRGKPIFHGLGNLLFDQIHRIGVRQAFFLHHYFFAGRLVQSVPVFTFMSDERQPTLASPEQAAAMKAIVFRDELLYR